MKKSRLERTHSLRFLLVRAIVTVVLVVIVLLGLRVEGITVIERDVPVQIVEDIAERSCCADGACGGAVLKERLEIRWNELGSGVFFTILEQVKYNFKIILI